MLPLISILIEQTAFIAQTHDQVAGPIFNKSHRFRRFNRQRWQISLIPIVAIKLTDGLVAIEGSGQQISLPGFKDANRFISRQAITDIETCPILAIEMEQSSPFCTGPQSAI